MQFVIGWGGHCCFKSENLTKHSIKSGRLLCSLSQAAPFNLLNLIILVDFVKISFHNI